MPGCTAASALLAAGMAVALTFGQSPPTEGEGGCRLQAGLHSCIKPAGSTGLTWQHTCSSMLHVQGRPSNEAVVTHAMLQWPRTTAPTSFDAGWWLAGGVLSACARCPASGCLQAGLPSGLRPADHFHGGGIDVSSEYLMLASSYQAWSPVYVPSAHRAGIQQHWRPGLASVVWCSFWLW